MMSDRDRLGPYNPPGEPLPTDQLPPDFRLTIASASTTYVQVLVAGRLPPAGFTPDHEHFFDNSQIPGTATALTISGATATPANTLDLPLRFHASRLNPIWPSGNYGNPGVYTTRSFSFADPTGGTLYIICEWDTTNVLKRFTWVKASATAPGMLWVTPPTFTATVTQAFPPATPPTGTSWFHNTSQ